MQEFFELLSKLSLHICPLPLWICDRPFLFELSNLTMLSLFIRASSSWFILAQHDPSCSQNGPNSFLNIFLLDRLKYSSFLLSMDRVLKPVRHDVLLYSSMFVTLIRVVSHKIVFCLRSMHHSLISLFIWLWSIKRDSRYVKLVIPYIRQSQWHLCFSECFLLLT